MAIKMRMNKDDSSTCKVCGADRRHSLEMFDIKFDDKHSITICDICNGVLFNKTLKADCMVHGKVKSTNDIQVINYRNRKKVGQEQYDRFQ